MCGYLVPVFTCARIWYQFLIRVSLIQICNELADRQAKEAAEEMSGLDVQTLYVLDNKEAVMESKKEMLNKWKLKYSCSEKTTSIQDIYTGVGKRNCHGAEDRGTFAVMNQLLSGHTLLYSHRAKINSNVS